MLFLVQKGSIAAKESYCCLPLKSRNLYIRCILQHLCVERLIHTTDTYDTGQDTKERRSIDLTPESSGALINALVDIEYWTEMYTP